MPGEVVGSARIRISVDSSNVEGEIDRTGKRVGSSLSKMAAVAGGAIAAVAPLTIEVAALTSSLASAASASVTVVPLLTAMGQGAGTVAIGMQGMADAIADGGAALAVLEPTARDFAAAVRGLQDEWQGLTAAVQQDLFAGADDDIEQLAAVYLPLLERNLTASARAINDFSGSFVDFLTASDQVEDLNTVLASQYDILDSLLDSVQPLTSAFFDFFVPVLPYAERLAADLEEGAENFAQWVEAGRESGEITAFFERAYANAENLLSSVRDLTGGIIGFFSAGEERGADMLETLARVSAEFREFAESAEGQAQFAEVFQFGAEYADAFGDTLANVGEAIVAVVAAFAPLMPTIVQVTGAITGPLLDGVTELANAFADMPEPIHTTVAALAALKLLNITSIFGPATQAARRFTEQMAVQAALARQSGAAVGTLGAATATASARFGAAAAGLRGVVSALGGPWVVAIGAAVGAVTLLSDAISQSDDELDTWADGLVSGLRADDVEGQLGRLRAELSRLGEEASPDKWDFAADYFLGWETSATQAGERTVELKDRIRELERQQDVAEQQNIEAIAALDGVTAAEARRANAVGTTAKEYEAQQKAAEEAISGIAESLAEFVAPVDAFETVNRRAAEAAAEAAGESATSWAEFTDSAKVSIDEFIAELDKQVQAQEDFATNVAEIAAQGFSGLAQALLEEGPAAAGAAAALVEGTDKQLARAQELYGRSTEDGMNAIATEMSNFIQNAPSLAPLGQKKVDEIAAGIATGETTLAEAVRRMGYVIDEETGKLKPAVDIDLNPAPFNERFSTVSADITALNNRKPTPVANLNPAPLNEGVAAANSRINNLDQERPTPVVDLSPTPFDETLTVVNGNINALASERPTPRADLDISQLQVGKQRGAGMVAQLDADRATPNADLDDAPLISGVRAAQRRVNGLHGKTVVADAEVRGTGNVNNLFDAINALYDRTVRVTTEFAYQGTPPPSGIAAPWLARGAIVTEPTLAGLGEAGPEVVLPLTDPARARELARAAGLYELLDEGLSSSSGSGGARTVNNINQTIMSPAADPELVAASVVDQLAAETT